MPPEGTEEPASWMPRPKASSVQTPCAGSPRLTARPRAVAIPTLIPVKVPGPSPTASRLTRSQPPAAATACSTSPRSRVACRGLPSGDSPSCDSCRTSPSRQAQATVSTVAVSKPTTVRGALPRDLEGPGPDFLAFHVPADDVAANDRRGDFVDVERPLFGFLGLRAEVFPARELDADGVGDVAVQAFEEGALLRFFRAGVGGFGVFGDPAADVVLVGGCARGGGHHYSQQSAHQHQSHERLQSLHPSCLSGSQNSERRCYKLRSPLPEHGQEDQDALRHKTGHGSWLGEENSAFSARTPFISRAIAALTDHRSSQTTQQMRGSA